MIDDIARMKSKAAFEHGLHSDQYRALEREWIDALIERGTQRPPVAFVLTRNCIELWLQSADDDKYLYVPSDKWDWTKFIYSPRPLREILVSEIRIASKALREALLIERGLQAPEEGEDEIDSNSSEL